VSDLQAVLRGDVASWHGLGDAVADEDLAAIAGPGAGPGEGRLSGMPVRFRSYDGPLGPLQAWFDDDDHVFLLWADRPPLERASAEILAALGEPGKRLTDKPSRFPGTVQWVWADRGLVAYVRDPEDEIRALGLFRPTTTEYYEQWLGASEGLPYRPWR
jgi:hypothetical protein